MELASLVVLESQHGAALGAFNAIPVHSAALKKKWRNRDYPSIEQIQGHVCDAYEITRDEMLARRNHAEVLRPRIIAEYLSRKLTLHSLPEIGRAFNRDHTSVLSALRSFERKLAKSQRLSGEVEQLGAEIILNRNLAYGHDKMKVSDASQLAALQTAVDIANGRVKLNASQRELFAAQIESIRRRIIDAAARRDTKTNGPHG